jgi:hypothetical protein
MAYKYSDQFKKELKELFPNSPQMHEAAEQGRDIVGRYLDDSTQGIGVTADEILLATSLEVIQAKVRMQKRKKELYVKWGNEIDSQRDKIG